MSTVSLTIEPKIMFSYPSARDYTVILKTVAELVDETSIQVDSEGVHIKALDPSRIAMLMVNIPPEAFHEFKVDESISVGLVVSNLTKILRNLRTSDKMVVAANEEYIEIIIEGTSPRRYKFRNISVLAEEVPELKPEYDVETVVLASPLKTAISELSDITSTIGVSADNEALTLFDYDTRKSTYKLTTASGNVVNLSVKKSATVPYDSEYLAKATNILGLSNVADLKYGSEAPLYISLEFAGGKVAYYLAAKL